MAVRAWVGFRDLKKPTPYDALMNLPDDAWLGDLAFTHPGEDVHAICDPVWYGTMTAAGKVDKTPLLKRLDSGEFSIIALSPASQFLFFGAGSTWVGDAIKRHYHINVEIPEYQLWERDASDVAAR